jgi:lysozyme
MARARRTNSRRNTRKKGRRRGWWFYLLSALLLAAICFWAWNWWVMREFVPDSDVYPEQGAAISERQGEVTFTTLRAVGAQFAYLEASRGSLGQDARFAPNLRAAREAGVKVGAVHVFDPCIPADGQSANFVTMVPRDGDLLAPVIALDDTSDDCPRRVSDASVESELMTLINQIEMHAGKPSMLKVSERFEKRYRISAQMERGLWLSRDRIAPAYAGRPWLMWSANMGLVTQASDQPLEWVVIQP